MYERLFSPLKINTIQLKNRIVMPSIHLMYNMDGHANEQFNNFYWRRAEGGVGLVITGGCRFDEYGGAPGMMSLETDEFIPGFKEFTNGMHARGTLVGVQLYHAGAYAHTIANDGRDALAPSEYRSKFTGEMTREITKEEMQTIARKWGEGALRAKQAGFDMVEISASAGYIICQFLSPKTNKRTDEYGGSWENRCRFPLEVITAVRKAVGADYTLGIRIAGNDFVPDSNTNAESVEFAKLAEKAGIDLINVTGGWHETIIPQLTGDVPPAGFAYLAAAIRDAVSVPVLASNRFGEPSLAERALAIGEADLIGICRPLLADPDLPKKAKQGKAETIRKCLSCNQRCLAKTFFAEPVECLVNGFVGREAEEKFEKTADPKSILVVGGGPAGCELAIRAATAGHKVSIWEKTRRLGGQLHKIARHPSKTDFALLADYYNAVLSELGVAVVFGKNADAQEIAKANFDIVVTATGNVPMSLDVGETEIPVCNAYEVMEGKIVAGRNVLVIGGGAVGCECADWLVRDAALKPEQAYFMLTQQSETTENVVSMLSKSRRKVTIIDIDKVGSGFEQGTAWPLLKDLDRFGVARYSFARLLSIDGSTISIDALQPKTREQKLKERETGIVEPEVKLELKFECDTIITAVSAKPDDKLFDELSTLGVNVRKIGDCAGIGRISDAVFSAIELADTL